MDDINYGRLIELGSTKKLAVIFFVADRDARERLIAP